VDLDLQGKSVIVAASSKGLGKAIATQFANEGAHVLISSRSEEGLQQTADEIRKQTENDQVRYQVCDITDANQVKQLVQTAIEWNGKVDVLINNAGGPPAGMFDDFSDEDWQGAFELNLLSYIRLIREVLPSMRQHGAGRIVNIASSSIKESLDNLLLSNTFRAGMVGLSKSLAREFASENILINTVGPGRIATDRVKSLDEIQASKKQLSYDEVREQAEAMIPMGRYGKPEEFGKTIVFLASGANTYVTGQTLVIDGGLVKAL
jgi:3-oxoacyl-[acyl-carrier protein] reductase